MKYFLISDNVDTLAGMALVGEGRLADVREVGKVARLEAGNPRP